MQSLEQALITFFRRAAARDESLLRAIDQTQCFTLASDRWCFTLPDLYAFLRQRSDTVAAVGYGEFRRAIYASPINKTVKRQGAEILIENNQGQVDRSVYALAWRTSDNPDRSGDGNSAG